VGLERGVTAPTSSEIVRVRGDAREAGEAERSRRLLEVTAAIAEAVTADQVRHALVDRMASALGATSVGLWFVSEDGERLTLVRSVGYGPALARSFESARLDQRPTFPGVDAIRLNAPLWISSQLEFIRAYPHLSVLASPDRTCSIACLPLMTRNSPRGCIAFSFADERLSDAAERDFLLLVARYSTQAVERLHLLEAERAQRAQSDAAAARLALLSRASRVFAEGNPQLQALFAAVAQHIIVDYADGCCIALLNADALDLVTVEHRDEGAARLLRASIEAEPFELGTGLVGTVAASGVPLLIEDVTTAELSRVIAPSRAAWVERYAPCSIVIVPLRVAGKVVGTLSAMRDDPQRAFSRDDLRLLEELSDRASLAVAAGRLYEANEQGRVRAELLYELAAGVIRARTVDEVFDAALAGIERALGATRCSILTYDPDGVMRFKAWRGLSERYRCAVEGHSPWSRSVKNPQPIVVPDVQRYAGLAAYSELFRSEGIGALGFIPIVFEQRLIGKFMVYYPAPREASAAELDMARAIANHVAAAIGRFSVLRELEQTVHFNEIFTGMLGHDLRNPLGAIMTAAQIAQRRNDNTQLHKPLSRILESGTRMATMIDQLLDFTRVRVGDGIPIDPHPADMAQIVLQAVNELKDAYPGVALRVTEAGDSAGLWDADRVMQAFSNLVANAVQHGDPVHGVSVRVEATELEAVTVRIHNMGEVPAELLPRLFEPMAGGDRRRSNSRGLGLGLYISREIVGAHGGSIAVESSPAGGTTFSVRLPRMMPGVREVSAE